MPTTTMNISLPEALKRYVHNRALEDHFSNPSDFVRSLIRDDQSRHAAEKLEQDLFAEFLRNNPEVPSDAWEKLRGDFRDRLSALRRDVENGIQELDRGEGKLFDKKLAAEIKSRGRHRLRGKE